MKQPHSTLNEMHVKLRNAVTVGSLNGRNKHSKAKVNRTTASDTV